MGVRNTEDSSFISWANGLRSAPAAMETLANHFQGLAREAEEEQPLATGLRDSLRGVAMRCTAAAERAAEWYPRLRDLNAADFAAYEEPRDGSVHKESRADVGRVDGDEQ